MVLILLKRSSSLNVFVLQSLTHSVTNVFFYVLYIVCVFSLLLTPSFSHGYNLVKFWLLIQEIAFHTKNYDIQNYSRNICCYYNFCKSNVSVNYRLIFCANLKTSVLFPLCPFFWLYICYICTLCQVYFAPMDGLPLFLEKQRKYFGRLDYQYCFQT